MFESLAKPTDEHEVFLSAQDIADKIGADKNRVLYWGRKQFLDRREKGHRIYPLSELRKARLLWFLIDKVGLDAGKASDLADGLLRMVNDEPQAVEALLELLEAMHEDLKSVLDILKEHDLHEEFVGAGASESEKGSGL